MSKDPAASRNLAVTINEGTSVKEKRMLKKVGVILLRLVIAAAIILVVLKTAYMFFLVWVIEQY